MLLCRVALKLLQLDASDLLRRACVISLEARPHLMPGIFNLLEQQLNLGTTSNTVSSLSQVMLVAASGGVTKGPRLMSDVGHWC